MVGRAMAVDLSDRYEVTAVDINSESLDKFKTTKVKTLRGDLSKESVIKKVVKEADLVVIAVPGFMGYETVKSVIKAGKDLVDISFYGEDPFGLDKLAKQKKVTAVVDCGIEPGMGNIIVGYWDSRMKIENLEFLVAGLPAIRKFPFDYKAPFSPVDVIEIYTRPARLVENGKVVVRKAMSDPELVFFDQIGTLEAFNTDGLRTLIQTTKIPNMKEKTMRYPGHIRMIEAFDKAGFFAEKPIEVEGKKIRPIDFTSKILFNDWKLKETDKELTVLRVTMTGKEKGKKQTVIYDMLDWFDEKTGFSSMARTTGYTATAVADLILTGKFSQKGICPPEYVGKKEDCFKFVKKYLADRGVNYEEKIS